MGGCGAGGGDVGRDVGLSVDPNVPHRRNKVLYHFSIMQQRRLRDHSEEEEEEKERKARKGGELRIHDLEDDLELSSDGSDGSDPDGQPHCAPLRPIAAPLRPIAPQCCPIAAPLRPIAAPLRPIAAPQCHKAAL